MMTSSRSELAPVFVLAPARSCSSLVAAMLGQHPELYGFPELRLFRAATVAELLIEPQPGAGMPARERTAGLVRALAQLHEGRQSVEAVERAFDWLRSRAAWDVTAVFDHLLALIAPLTGVEKSPETTRSDHALSRASRAYPSARYLHLVRHPWSTVASMLSAWSGLSYWKVPSSAAPQLCLDTWREQHARIAAFGEQVGPERFLRVQAENLINHPGEVLPVLCRWLGISSDEACITAMVHPERSPYSTWGPSNAGGGFDPKFLTSPALHEVSVPSSLAPPAEWSFRVPSLQGTMELVRQFGYDANRARREDVGMTRFGASAASRTRTPACRELTVSTLVTALGETCKVAPKRATWRAILAMPPEAFLISGIGKHRKYLSADSMGRVGTAQRGATVWFTGLPCSGKTSVASEVARVLLNSGNCPVVLDGDELRRGLSADLGFSATDRNEHVRRVSALAHRLARAGIVVLVALVSPYRAGRGAARDLHRASELDFFEVHVDTPLDECERRDTKGLYRLARAGRVPNVTGIDGPYERPAAPNLRLTPADGDVREQAALVLRLLVHRVSLKDNNA
ncbi:adenylyl-sulfate kinase [Paraburkholderia sp. MM5477-R1]|uniref:adenylyl-sulfate kinase n=1 Tax=Paraburkholderia sp. MM5477-R1 TaxID=2991062 RepID=UPI003D1E0F5E